MHDDHYYRYFCTYRFKLLYAVSVRNSGLFTELTVTNLNGIIIITKLLQ